MRVRITSYHIRKNERISYNTESESFNIQTQLIMNKGFESSLNVASRQSPTPFLIAFSPTNSALSRNYTKAIVSS